MLRCIQCLVLFFLLTVGAPQAQNHTPTPLPVIPLSVGVHLIHAELAATPSQRQTGLMGRKALPTNGGMLFVFDEIAPHCMWMRNTLISLSVAFINDDGQILNIEDMQPRTDTTHCAAQPARYALEMELGWFTKRGIKPGALINKLPR